MVASLTAAYWINRVFNLSETFENQANILGSAADSVVGQSKLLSFLIGKRTLDSVLLDLTNLSAS